MFGRYILTPPARTKEQVEYYRTGSYRNTEELLPHLDFLRQYQIPIWTLQFGQPANPQKIVIIFSHGNSRDVPDIKEMVFDLMHRIVEETSSFVTLIMWDYPGYSFSPLTTKEFLKIEEQFLLLCMETTQGQIWEGLGIQDQPLFLIGHSLGACAQTVALKDPRLSGKIAGVMCLAPFYNLLDMSKKYFFGEFFFTSFGKEYHQFCNVAEHIRNRVDTQAIVQVVLFAKDQVTSSGPGALMKFEDLVGIENVKTLRGSHDTPIVEAQGREECARLFRMLLNKSKGAMEGAESV